MSWVRINVTVDKSSDSALYIATIEGTLSSDDSRDGSLLAREVFQLQTPHLDSVANRTEVIEHALKSCYERWRFAQHTRRLPRTAAHYRMDALPLE